MMIELGRVVEKRILKLLPDKGAEFNEQLEDLEQKYGEQAVAAYAIPQAVLDGWNDDLVAVSPPWSRRRIKRLYEATRKGDVNAGLRDQMAWMRRSSYLLVLQFLLLGSAVIVIGIALALGCSA
jgi:hypothetical protein